MKKNRVFRSYNSLIRIIKKKLNNDYSQFNSMYIQQPDKVQFALLERKLYMTWGKKVAWFVIKEGKYSLFCNENNKNDYLYSKDFPFPVYQEQNSYNLNMNLIKEMLSEEN